ncbi:hypothetical protein [Nocardia sp. NPDC059229]|uniref:hypothetical protein n=1 Tax=Nocardia sp. NPDC059229 TaxID=3346778 RepID=UPI0036A6B361
MVAPKAHVAVEDWAILVGGRSRSAHEPRCQHGGFTHSLSPVRLVMTMHEIANAADSFIGGLLHLCNCPDELVRCLIHVGWAIPSGSSRGVSCRHCTAGQNQAIFKRLYVFEEQVTGHEFQPVIAELHAIQAGYVALQRGQGEAT